MQFKQFSFDPRINAGIQSAGYQTPTPIQSQVIPHILQKRDVLGLAQTGTGKTAAFVLPILQHLGSSQSHHVRALILAPTRELAEQIHGEFKNLGRQTKVHSTTVYGGVSRNRQVQDLRRGADIVVACPGRLLDLMGTRDINLSQVEILVLDEADRMCDMGFLPDIRRILKQIPAKRQTLFFSATMPDEIRELADGILHNPASVQIGMNAPVKTVSHTLYPVPQQDKTSLITTLLRDLATGRVLIFTRTKYRARNLASKLSKEGFHTSALQGNMSQNQRQSAMNGFRKGKYDILVATDIASRGIDVSEISHVINFDMPDTVDAYIHRIGRTGRAEETGEAFTFCSPEDESMIRDIEKVLGSKIERKRLEGFNYSKQSTGRPQNKQKSGRNYYSSSGKKINHNHRSRAPQNTAG